MRIAVVNGPNLNRLGQREPALYGQRSLAEIERELEELAVDLGAELSFFQSNHEGALIDFLQGAADSCDGIVINAGGLTHSSVCLRDALLATALPFVEVHLTNVFAREPFRRRSLLADVAVAVISGAGPIGYELGLRALLARP